MPEPNEGSNMEITVVKEENQEYFKPLMPKEQWEEADLVLGAIENGVACGVLAVTEEPEDIINLLYLMVAKDYRRKGIATALLEGLHKLGRHFGMNMTICQYALNHAQKDLDLCLSKNLFELDEIKSPVYRVAFKDLSAKYFKETKLSNKQTVTPLSEVTARVWNRFTEKLEKAQTEDGSIPELEVKYLYDQEASFLLMKRGEPMGCILLERLDADYLLSYFCVLKDASPLDMMQLFQASYQVLEKYCTPSSQLYINALTETTEKLVKNLTDKKAVLQGQAVTRYYFY